MIYPEADKLDALDSKYGLVIVAAKRARQLKEGARNLNGSKSANPLTTALEEIAAGYIIPLQVGEPEKLPTRVAATPVLGGLVATSMDEDMRGGLDDEAPSAAELSAMLRTPDENDGFDDFDDDDLADDNELALDGEVPGLALDREDRHAMLEPEDTALLESDDPDAELDAANEAAVAAEAPAASAGPAVKVRKPRTVKPKAAVEAIAEVAAEAPTDEPDPAPAKVRSPRTVKSKAEPATPAAAQPAAVADEPVADEPAAEPPKPRAGRPAKPKLEATTPVEAVAVEGAATPTTAPAKPRAVRAAKPKVEAVAAEDLVSEATAGADKPAKPKAARATKPKAGKAPDATKE